MAPAVASSAMTKITLSFLLSLMSDNNFQGPEAPANSKHHWAYKGPEGPDTWNQHYKLCAGERQSPIDIVTSSCTYDPHLEPIILDHFDTTSGHTGPCILNVTNNGHAASVRVISETMRVRGGGLGQTYKTAEFHFHWGSTDDVGSEHALNGRKYPLEMHVVNFAEKYGTIKRAMAEPDGLAVLGVLFELSDMENPYFAALDEALRHVHKAGEHTTVSQLSLRSLLPEDLTKFWRYNGSLTTPYCFETVTWTIFAEPQKISRSQLETLRALLYEQGHEVNDRGDKRLYTPSRLVDNWRPVQPLNGRLVKQSFDGTYGGFSLINPLKDAKISPYSVSVPAADNFGKTSRPGGSAGVNEDPMTRVALSQVHAQQRAVINEQSGNAQSHRTALNNQRGGAQSQGTALNNQISDPGVNDPMGGKYFISNVGPSASGINSNSFTASPDHPHPSGSNVDTLTTYNPSVTLFRQIQRSSPDSAANKGQGSPNTQQGQQMSHQPSGSPSNNNVHLMSSAASEAFPAGQLQQRTPGGKMLGESNADSAMSPPRVQSPSPSYEIQGSRGQTQSQTVQNVAEVISPTQQQNNHLQQHVSPQGNPNSRAGFIDNRIAALANQIRLHRQHGQQQHHQNGSQSSTFTNSNNLPSPPVVRHNQHGQPVTQDQQTRFYTQSRQHNDLQQQRQQILHMSRPPTAQQLRAILERLAATNRVNAPPATITSGAASIPRGMGRDANNIGGSSSTNIHHPSNLANARVIVSPGRFNANEVSGQMHPVSSVTSPARSSGVYPTANAGLGSQTWSPALLPQPNWVQTFQPRSYPQQGAYQLQSQIQQQQQHHLQQEAYRQQMQIQQQQRLQQEAYQQQTQTQQQFFLQNPAPQYNYFVRTVDSAEGQPSYSVDSRNNMPHVYLTNSQQPTRIRRPTLEQISNWQHQQQQYQRPDNIPLPLYF